MPAGAVESTKTTCPYCGVGCGVLVDRAADGMLSVRGDPAHPANFGRLCSKGSALAETLSLDDRILTPEILGKRATWDAAIDRIASEFSKAIKQHGPNSVAFYGSGQLLTEDYYLLNKLAKGYVGTANIDTNSRLCMASSVAGHKRAFGSDTVPGCYEDFDAADLFVLVGSNAAWCHPVLYQRMIAAKEANPSRRLVVIDPRRTETCDGADLHLALRPGSDAVLFNGLLAHLNRAGFVDEAYVAAHTHGYGETLAGCGRQSVEETARICGLPLGSVQLFFDWFAKTKKVVTLYSQGINQSTSGTDKVNAIINCHLITGRIGQPGAGPFSLTGQPNAMGGREVGGLANQLAAHMEIGNAAHRALVQRFWQSPTIAAEPGLKAVDLFDAVHDGRIKAVWILSTNPLVSLPDATRARAALKTCAFVAVSDCVRTSDTVPFAHVLLPAASWGEKNGTVTNSERRISRQRAFMAAPGEARPDWQAVRDVAARMGFDGFAHASPAAVFREHAALSAFENKGARDFDIGGLAALDDAGYGALEPVQWPVRAGVTPAASARFFSDGQFFTPDRKARFIAVTPRPPANATSKAFPFILNTGRVRDHWHTLTRTGKSARLTQHSFEPYAEMHPLDAEEIGVRAGELVRLTSQKGGMIARVAVTPAARRGCIFAPMHWGAAQTAKGSVNALMFAATDPVSGQPELKQSPVAAAPLSLRYHACLFSRALVAARDGVYAVAGRFGQAFRLEFAGDDEPADWESFARGRMGLSEHDEWMAYRDATLGSHRFAKLRGGRLESCLFIAREPQLPSRAWLASLFGTGELSDDARRSLMAGRALTPAADTGALVCACFNVGANQIAAAVAAGHASVEGIGRVLNAGTNCGSCKPELRRLAERGAAQAATVAAQPA